MTYDTEERPWIGITVGAAGSILLAFGIIERDAGTVSAAVLFLMWALQDLLEVGKEAKQWISSAAVAVLVLPKILLDLIDAPRGGLTSGILLITAVAMLLIMAVVGVRNLRQARKTDPDSSGDG